MYPETSWRSARLLALLGVMTLSGCSADMIAGRAPMTDPIPLKRNMVAFTTLDHDIHFDRGSRLMTAAETQSLLAFLRTSAASEGGDVTIGVSSGDDATMAAARQATVLAVLSHLHVAALPAADPALGTDAIRLRVARYAVVPPLCPDWRKPEADEPTNSPSSNFGCATETSLALMVANPADLLRGTSVSGADGEALARGVVLYRSGALSKSLAASGSGASAAGVSGGGAATGGGGQ